MNKFIDTVQRAIDGKYCLTRRKEKWVLEEGQSKTEVHFSTEESIAFSLDQKNLRPFAFFSKKPPKHFAKMCDAIFFCYHENSIYLFIIEEKTANLGDCEKQLINGKLFCDWLIALCIQHTFPDLDVNIIPLLIWKPQQKSPRKGETGHRNDDDSIKKKKFSQFEEEGFEISNRCDVFIVDLILRLGRA